MADNKNSVPINAVIGWNEGITRKRDAVAIAQGHIAKRFTASDSSWYAVAPFLGGFLWEAQEGGDGTGYIGSVMDALSGDPSKEYWFPSGDRAFKVMMRDGKPIGILLSERESAQIFDTDQPPLVPKSKLLPAQRKGTATMAVGIAMSGAGAFYLMSSMVFYGLFANPGPSVTGVDFAALPHAQWNMVDKTKVTEIVSKLEFKDSRWDVNVREHEVPGLQELIDTTESLIEGIKKDIQPTPIVEPDRLSPSGVDLQDDQIEADTPADEESNLSSAEILRKRVLEMIPGSSGEISESQSIIKNVNDEANAENLPIVQEDGAEQ